MAQPQIPASFGEKHNSTIIETTAADSNTSTTNINLLATLMTIWLKPSSSSTLMD
jgi:hypothetical protein